MAKSKLAKLDLSRFNSQEKLPANVISIIKNALCVYEGNTSRVAKLYNLDKEKVDFIFEEYYLQLTQIIDSQIKSKELDTGISNAISLMADHINSLENTKTSDTMTASTVHNVTKMTDRLISLKQQFNNTYDTLVNKMQEQSLKIRQVEVLENGKPEDSTEYATNQQVVANMMQQYLDDKVQKKVILINVKTYEVKTFEGDRAKQDAEQFLGCIGHLSDVARQKSPYKGEWLVHYEGKESKYSNREY